MTRRPGFTELAADTVTRPWLSAGVMSAHWLGEESHVTIEHPSIRRLVAGLEGLISVRHFSRVQELRDIVVHGGP